AEKPLHARRVVQEEVLVRGNRLHVLAQHRGQDAAPHRVRRVLSKVVAVAEVDALEQKPDLDLLDLRPQAIQPKSSAQAAAHRVSQDLSMASRCALLTGLAM